MKNKWLAVLLSAAMTASLVMGCGGSGKETSGSAGSSTEGTASESEESSAASADGEKVIRYATSSSPSGIFQPMYHNDQYNGYVTYNVYESLTQVNESGETEGVLAKDWDISEDGKTYTFYLNEGVTWHDGEPFTANDVAFTYNFMAQPGFNGYNSSYIAEIEGYDEVQAGTAETLSGVEVIDDYTISVTTTEVYSSLLNRIGGRPIIAEHIWKDVDVATADQQTDLIKNPVGTGPFKLEEFVPDQYVTLVANEDYWQGVPKIDELIYITVNADTSQAQMLNGELDVLALSSLNDDDIALYEGENFDIEYYPFNSYQCMQINQQEEEFQPAEIRQAITYAIDRQGIVDALLYGHGCVANTIYAESYWAHPGNDVLQCYEYNPEKAIEIFESLGYSYDADANIMSDPEGNPVTWRLFCPTGNKVREQSATVIQSNLGEIGITIDLETMEFATLISILQDTSDPTRFDFALTGYGMGADPDVSTLVMSGAANNYSSYSGDKIDELCTTALHTADEAERAAVYKDLAIEVSKELPVIYLYNMESASALNPSVHITDNPYWTAYNAYLWTVD